MINENKEEKPVIFNTPAGFNFQNLFENHSIKFKPKVEFVIHQINYYDNKGGYQIHSKNHQWFLGIKGTELAMILRKLVESSIIKLAANYHPGNTSNTYRMVTPFDFKAPDTQKSFYYANEVLFVKKWIMDEYIVKNASTTSFIKELKTTVNASTMAAQQKQINILQAQVLALLGQLKTGIQNQSLLDMPPIAVVDDKPPVSKTPEPKDLVDELPMEKETRLEEPGRVSELILPTSADTVAPVDVANDEQDISELAMMFGLNTSTTSEVEDNDLPITEEKIVEPVVVEESNPIINNVAANSELSSNKTPDCETFRGNLKIYYMEEGLAIQHGDTWGALSNYDEMKPWCEKLPEFEKQRLYHHIITSTEKEIRFPLNYRNKVLFSRDVVNGDIQLIYRGVSAA